MFLTGEKLAALSPFAFGQQGEDQLGGDQRRNFGKGIYLPFRRRMFSEGMKFSETVADPERRVFAFMPYGAVKLRNNVACIFTDRASVFVRVADDLIPPQEGQFDEFFVFPDRDEPVELCFSPRSPKRCKSNRKPFRQRASIVSTFFLLIDLTMIHRFIEWIMQTPGMAAPARRCADTLHVLVSSVG